MISDLVFSMLNLLGLYHDAVISKAKNFKMLLGPKFGQTRLHNKYYEHFMGKSAVFYRLALVLTLLRYTETLAEMIIKKKLGNTIRWNFIVILEAIK
jgi:peroxin-16